MVDFRLPLFWSILTNIYLFGGCSDYKVCLKIGDASKLRFRTMVTGLPIVGNMTIIKHVMEWGSFMGSKFCETIPYRSYSPIGKSPHDSIPSGSVEDEVKASSRGCTDYFQTRPYRSNIAYDIIDINRYCYILYIVSYPHSMPTMSLLYPHCQVFHPNYMLTAWATMSQHPQTACLYTAGFLR